jgi:hypothetical protein
MKEEVTLIPVEREILDIALGLLYRKEFSIEEITALNKVVSVLAPLLAPEVKDEEKPAE